MNIAINIESLYEYGLSANEYIVLFLIKNNKLNDTKFNYDKALEKLKEKQYIDSNGNLTIKIPDELFGDNKVEDLDIYWEQFKDMYPKKDGPRRLHDSPSPCKAKYLRLLKKDLKVHEKVLKGLQSEIDLRSIASKRDDFFPAPKLMSTYINNKSWEGYLDVEEEHPSNSGRDLI